MILVLQRSQSLPLHHRLLSHTVHQVLHFHWEGAFPSSKSFSATLSWFGSWLTLAKVKYSEIWCHSHAWNNKRYGRRKLGQRTVIQQCRLGQISLHTFCPSLFYSTSSRVRTLSQCWSSKLHAWWMHVREAWKPEPAAGEDFLLPVQSCNQKWCFHILKERNL